MGALVGLEQLHFVLEHVAGAANALDLDGDECAALDQVGAQGRATGVSWPVGGRLRRAEAAEDVSSGAGAEQAVRAVARVELVPELLCERDVAAENDRRQEPLQ